VVDVVVLANAGRAQGLLPEKKFDQLTPSEIASLQQSKKSIADYVQRELSERMKQRHLEHMVPKV